MPEVDIEKINQTINDTVDAVNNVIDTTREALLKNPKRQLPTLYRKTSHTRAGGVVQSIFGYTLLGMGAIAMAIGIIGSGVVGAIGGGLMIAAGLPLGVGGTKKVNRVDRFRDYINALGNRTFINLKALSESTGKSVKFLQKDLGDMMERKMFLQGHFDDDCQGLIVSDETYQDYRRAVALQGERAAEEAAANESLKDLSTEGKRIYRLGEDYIAKIQRINAELPGEVITEKLQRLEDVIRRILDEVVSKPDKISDLRKLMNYYLPTTWKLLESYKQIEREKVKTEQMRETQCEIENTLDTVNNAFENLLDQLFQSHAWDIKSDISVLNTMLAKDSLKDNEFTVNKEESQK